MAEQLVGLGYFPPVAAKVSLKADLAKKIVSIPRGKKTTVGPSVALSVEDGVAMEVFRGIRCGPRDYDPRHNAREGVVTMGGRQRSVHVASGIGTPLDYTRLVRGKGLALILGLQFPHYAFRGSNVGYCIPAEEIPDLSPFCYGAALVDREVTYSHDELGPIFWVTDLELDELRKGATTLKECRDAVMKRRIASSPPWLADVRRSVAGSVELQQDVELICFELFHKEGHPVERSVVRRAVEDPQWLDEFRGDFLHSYVPLNKRYDGDPLARLDRALRALCSPPVSDDAA